MRKPIALILVIVLTAQLFFQFSVSAALPELDGSELQNIEKLTALGIFEKNDEIRYTIEITRSQFVKYALRIAGCPEGLGNIESENPFVDLSANDENYNAVLIAYATGMISGEKEALTFRPNDVITYEEAAKILLFILGYGEIADMSGGYPLGYWTTALQLRLFPNSASISSGDSIAAPALSQILLRALDIEPLQFKAFNSDGGFYSTMLSHVKGESLLWVTRKVGYARGILEENMFTSLYGKSPIMRNTVKIDEVIYDTAGIKAWDLIGLNVEIYYQHEADGDSDKLLYIAPLDNGNIVHTIMGDQISRATDSLVVYYDDDRNKQISARVSRTASFLWNMEQTVIEPSRLKNENNIIKLIDNDKDGIVDVISVINYRVIQVDASSAYDFTISDFWGGEKITLDPKDSRYRVHIEKNNKAASFEAIEATDIISYAESSENTTNIKLLQVSSAKITGTVNEINNTNSCITVGGIEYKALKSFFDSVSVGMSGEFSLDFLGRLAAHSKGTPNKVYGYLNGLRSEGKLSTNIKAQIFTENNRWVELNLRPMISFKGEPMKSDIFFKLYGGDADEYRQLVTYSVDMNGDIREMNFAIEAGVDFKNWSDEENQFIDSGTFRMSKHLASDRYRIGTQSFGGLIGLSSSVKIFSIPAQTASQPADTEEFSILSLTDMVSDNTYTNIFSYDADRTGITNICVIKGDPEINSVINTSTVYVVAGLSAMSSDDGEVCDAVKLHYGEEKISIPLARGSKAITEAKQLKEGDIIQYKGDRNGKIISLTRHFSIDGGTEQKVPPTSAVYSAGSFATGQIQAVNYDAARFILDFGAANNYICSLPANVNVYLYHTNSKVLEKGSPIDLMKDDYCFVRLNYLQARDIIIFK
ncbi:MAG: S-layer homology domain-containing protein [Firmicutes bacterium]|nr:S-layer homology domain-containing protein [Bacillota bacterium]